ncbi:hypothetical protein [Coxiella burnetii]|uniref:Uncharacterized protein n=1 Tax=Coxiella burnetii (strain RSA 493 / Nine Mile phase I) TaxID=227377 RepID=Q83CE2_COXBU|nr:hypothetical protein [Coxiella burnetii]NP_820173.1 hypothetical protein CBU_1178 [Coxiella burnetii RSA 493]AAO90687.1 hypothetical protein CBU_1178 [Coxiella burnetii RSA 493]ARI65976.1 hypothetical protein B7L74_06060 [Coxiella burnetii]ARK27438.1 hypothetical protein BMW92_05885 [Coxiella burnetii]MCF2093602.1 hypothetical protein [Coxiella burnetii]MCF2095690.1 hypothetical protein [Coxiella burnetii]
MKDPHFQKEFQQHMEKLLEDPELQRKFQQNLNELIIEDPQAFQQRIQEKFSTSSMEEKKSEISSLQHNALSQSHSSTLIKPAFFLFLLYYRQLVFTAVGLDEQMMENMEMFRSAFELLFIKTVAEIAQWLPLQPLARAATTTSFYLSNAAQQSYTYGERAWNYFSAKRNPEKYADLCKFYLANSELKNARWAYFQIPANNKEQRLELAKTLSRQLLNLDEDLFKILFKENFNYKNLISDYQDGWEKLKESASTFKRNNQWQRAFINYRLAANRIEEDHGTQPKNPITPNTATKNYYRCKFNCALALQQLGSTDSQHRRSLLAKAKDSFTELQKNAGSVTATEVRTDSLSALSKKMVTKIRKDENKEFQHGLTVGLNP